MAFIKKLKAANGTYTDSNTGEEKTNWVDVGFLNENKDGKKSIKITSIPVGEWDGWVNIFDMPEKKQQGDQF